MEESGNGIFETLKAANVNKLYFSACQSIIIFKYLHQYTDVFCVCKDVVFYLHSV